MKQLILFIILSANSLFCFGQTQQEMNEEADKKYLKADKELNTTYHRILKIYSGDTAFIRKLKIAQKIWVQFRDAEMNALFPDEHQKGAYGSVFPMCWSMHLTELTKERNKRLMIWINGIEEGDVCSGSVRIK